MKKFAAITYLVRDYDEAINWFRACLGFTLLEDTPLSASKRWVRVAPPDATTCFLLAQADCDQQRQSIANAAGGRVAFFLHTNSFDNDYTNMMLAGVKFLEMPRTEPYGKVAVFEDLYGNKWDLVEPISTQQKPGG